MKLIVQGKAFDTLKRISNATGVGVPKLLTRAITALEILFDTQADEVHIIKDGKVVKKVEGFFDDKS